MRSAALLALLPLALAAPLQETGAPVIVPRGATGNKYIVRLKKPAAAAAGSSGIASLDGLGSMIAQTVNTIVANAEEEFHNLNAFTATLGDDDLASLRANPNVQYIEKDGVMKVQATQSGAPWGIARLSNTNTGSTTYTYDNSAGEGTCVYVIDTGIDVTHPEFEGRATFVKNTVDSDNTDGHGHGTHVAGTVGSKTYGVAKKTKLFAVKVFGASGQGSTSAVIAGMDFVLEDAPKRSCPKGIVVNMSLGGSVSDMLDETAREMVSNNLALVVAAGNGDSQGRAVAASTTSPARVTQVCTVGATDSSDRIGSFSNYGSVVDVQAPGVSILSTQPNGKTGTLTGTSMATPHVAGLAAYFLGLGATTPANACSYIVSKAQTGKITGLRSDTVNKLAHN